MRKALAGILFIAMAIAFVAKGAYASEVDVSGVVRADYYGDSNKASISQVRFNLYAPTATDTYYFARVEPNRYNLDAGDELKLAFVSYGEFMLGRIPLIEGYTLPAPDKLFTVSWPRIPGGFYGYGIQWQRKLLSEISLMAEISASPNSTVAKGNWGYSQTSLRLAKDSSQGFVAFILRYDDNQDSQISLSGERKYEHMGILARGVFYLKYDGGVEKNGGYVFLEKSISSNLYLHLQTDFAQKDNAINTVGLRVIHGKSFAVLDYERSANTDRLLGSIVVAIF